MSLHLFSLLAQSFTLFIFFSLDFCLSWNYGYWILGILVQGLRRQMEVTDGWELCLVQGDRETQRGESRAQVDRDE